jgi:hypothetical protein
LGFDQGDEIRSSFRLRTERRPMSTEPEPVEYPDSWKTADIRRREAVPGPAEFERWLASLSPAELQAALMRARGLNS